MSPQSKRSLEIIVVWFTRSLTGLVTYLAINIYIDVKQLNIAIPVVQEQIRLMQQDSERLKNKIFVNNLLAQPAIRKKKWLMPDLVKNN